MNTAIYLLKQYWKNAKGYRPLAAVIAALLFVSLSLWILDPLIFGEIINTVQHYSGQTAIERVIVLSLLWIGIYVVFNIMFRYAMYLASKLGYDIKAAYIARNYRKLSNLSLKWHADHHSGETISRVGRAADSLHDMAAYQEKYFDVAIQSVGSFVGLAYLNWKVALLAALIVAALYSLLSFFDRRMRSRMDEINNLQNRIYATLYDFVANMRSIITLRLGERTARELDAKVQAAKAPTVRTWGVLAQWKWITLSMSFMVLQTGTILYFVLTSLYAGETINLGMLTAMYIYLDKIGAANFGMTSLYNGMMKDKAAIENAQVVEEALDMLPACAAPESWQKFEASGIKFSHSGSHGKNVICNANFCFNRGEKIALMGESGAGKSTILMLLRGLAHNQAGSIFIDGRKRAGGLGALSARTTLMLQDPEVFEHTLRYNITMGLDYSDADVAKALRMSRFDQVLKKLPEGLQTDIREKGVNLSGGERQRLALARNILAARDSEIILMDEITSSVDVKNEALIYDALLREFKDKTIIAAVHKPAMAAKFQRIMRISAGAMKN